MPSLLAGLMFYGAINIIKHFSICGPGSIKLLQNLQITAELKACAFITGSKFQPASKPAP
jgi:hypothetical protein